METEIRYRKKETRVQRSEAKPDLRRPFILNFKLNSVCFAMKSGQEL